MKVYLVGGAVRDTLLGRPVKEKDWVVVGATPEELLAQGFQQVGKDFPVFLHPSTGDEYALARTERKKGRGYYGFTCDYNPNVTLEEDLARRDLTINAMAMDEQGTLYDPYYGAQDLQAGLLRHVSAAFVEDPVRVLRVARFAARFSKLGFKVANETRQLMYQMVKDGELNHLVPERVWQEWQRSLSEPTPEIFIQTLRSCGALKIILPELDALYGVPNPPRHHPEIDSGVHTLQVLQAACRLSEDELVRFAALVHDLGKAKTPMSDWPSHHRHEHLGLDVIQSLCERLRIPNEYRKLALMVCRYHLNIHRYHTLKASTVVSILEKADAFRRPELFQKMLLASQADSLGKNGEGNEYTEIALWQKALKICQSVSAKPLVEEGLKGEAIKNELHKQRINRLQSVKEKRVNE
ncbi:multifunctional CCA addition/repair protein [Legionella yabuuchiae]|uniref:multifunctional CCA addition/repair protein n=1 Tax=Legionella yabuuchiae TaxID=376727 RepID=UPI001055DA3D|nr:multifunctional CCA addition/repair protein [Legionella yabuuchiae]